MTGPMILIPSLSAREPAPGRIGLTRKFVEGMTAYVERWPGPVRLLIERTGDADSNLDHADFALADLPFEVGWLPTDEAGLREALSGAAMASAALYYRDVGLASLCRGIGVPLVYTSEYSLKTRNQIVRAETRNPLLRLRRSLWNTGLERRYVGAARLASGMQCNGTPTYDAYRGVNPRTMLFFDTRVGRDMVVGDDVLRARVARMANGGPLRLCFSGRLIAIKGADHLPAVAAALAERGVDFTLDICGGGDLEPAMKEQVRRAGLQDRVRFKGVLNFAEELIPFVSREIDMFVCCHRQGDPSCTYLETMSCGVPIAGYANEAFEGLVGVSGQGWLSPIDDPAALAAAIAGLARGRIAAASFASREFAARHTFDRTMDLRVEHLLACRDRVPTAAAS